MENEALRAQTPRGANPQGANSTATGLGTEVKNVKTKIEETKTLAEGIAKASSQDGEESKRIARESHVLASSLQTRMQTLLQDMAEITKTYAAFEQAQRLKEEKACAPGACPEAAAAPAVEAEYMEEQERTEPTHKRRRGMARKPVLPEASDSKSDPAVPFLDGTEEMKTFRDMQKHIEQISRVLNLPVSAFSEEDKQVADASDSQSSKGKESSSQSSSTLEHPHQGHHAIEALKLDIYWARRDFEKAIKALNRMDLKKEDLFSDADANPIAGEHRAMSGSSSKQEGVEECLDKCRWLEQLHRDEIEVRKRSACVRMCVCIYPHTFFLSQAHAQASLRNAECRWSPRIWRTCLAL
jgi:hypothetical protein